MIKINFIRNEPKPKIRYYLNENWLQGQIIQGQTIKSIADICNVTTVTIRNHFKKFGLSHKEKLPFGFKRCIKCKEIKLITEFYKSKKRKDGYFTVCKSCHKSKYNKEYLSQRYQSNKKALKEIQKYYNKKTKEKFLNGEKKIAEGKICPRCKQYKMKENFYQDFNNPTGLYVYCKPCHIEYQRELRGGNKRDEYKQIKNKEYLQQEAKRGKTIKIIALENNCSYAIVTNWAKRFNIKFKL